MPSRDQLLGLSLRLRLVLAFMVLVALTLVVGLASLSITNSIRGEVEDLQSGVGTDLRGNDLANLELEIKGHWDPAGTFVASEVEARAGARRPKLRGAVQAVDRAARRFTLYGREIALVDDTNYVDVDLDGDGIEQVEAGMRVEVSCTVDDGRWVARELELGDVKLTDKIKCTPTSWDIDGDPPESLEVHGLVVTLRPSGGPSPASALRRIEMATDLSLALHDCRSAAHELVGRTAAAASGDVDLLGDEQPDESGAADRLRRAVGEFHFALLGTPAGGDGPVERPALPPDAARWVAALADREPLLRSHVGKLLNLADDHPLAARRHLDDVLDPFLGDELQPIVNAFLRETEDELGDQLEDIVARGDDTTRIALYTTGAAMVIGLVLAFLVWRSVHRPVVALHDAARRLGAGHLDTRVDLPGGDEFGVLAQAFNRMAEALAVSTVSIGNLENIFDSMSGALLLLDRERRIARTNRAAEELLGYGAGELVGLAFDQVCATAEGDTWRPDLTDAAGGPAVTECEMLRKDGSRVAASVSGSELRHADGASKGAVCVAQDLTAWKDAQHRIEASLAEKELLLREVHHRVKNNMQIISSLMEMQAMTCEDPAAMEPFVESQSRVRSMALIHEQLYQSDDLGQIDVRSYLSSLGSQLATAFGRSRPIELTAEVQDAPLDLDQCLACGLIVNELVVNAYKHAFPGDREGHIRILLRSVGEGLVELTVCDDGTGGDDGASDQPRGGAGLGSSLVRTLARQLRGEMSVSREDGHCVTVRFPESTTARAAGADVAAPHAAEQRGAPAPGLTPDPTRTP